MWPLSSSSGTVSTNVSLPWRRITSVTGSSWARNSTNSAMPPSWRNFSSTGVSPRRSRITSSSPGTMNEVWRARPSRPSSSKRGVLGEDLPVGPEPDAGAGPVLRDPAALAGQTRPRGEAGSRAVAVEDAGHPAAEAHPLRGRRPLDVDVHPRGQRVDDRQARRRAARRSRRRTRRRTCRRRAAWWRPPRRRAARSWAPCRSGCRDRRRAPRRSRRGGGSPGRCGRRRPAPRRRRCR